MEINDCELLEQKMEQKKPVEEAYVSLEIAKALKDNGFCENCRAGYNIKTGEFSLFDYTIDNLDTDDDWVAAPTQQMAMRWLREVQDLYISIGYCSDINKFMKKGYYAMVTDMNGDNKRNVGVASFKTYEESADAGIKYALDLIKI